MSDLISVNEYPVRNFLKTLLKDRTTGKNIIWATDAYSERGAVYTDKDEILESSITQGVIEIKPRVVKSLEEQQLRTRKKAEVMTPVWLCNQMNNYLDEDWFGVKGIFNTENDDHTWTASGGKIPFKKENGWKKYVDSKRLEITCGEAPYLVSRYDTTTGELIKPPSIRIGLLDRKLRVVNENTGTEEEWKKWAMRAMQSCYGYEYQGDNLLIARINMFLSYVEYYRDRWEKDPDDVTLRKIARIISWNIWQMDGLKDCVPLGKAVEEDNQIDLYSCFPELMQNEARPEKEEVAPFCKIHDWRANETKLFKDYKEKE